MPALVRQGLLPRGGGLIAPADGLLPGIASRGPALLLDIDYRTPKVVTKHSTAADIAAKLGVSASEVVECWTCDEASGNLVGKIAGYTLAPQGTGYGYQRTIPGWWNGTDMHSHVGVRTDLAGSGRFEDATTSHLDDDGTTSRAFFVAFRSSTNGSRRVFEKTSSGAGYWLRYNTSKTLQFQVNDGTTTKGAAAPSASAQDELSWACCIIDRTAASITLHTKDGTTTTAITGLGSFSVAAGFTVGSNGLALDADIAYMVAIEGSGAEGISQADCEALWQAGQDPGSPSLDTYTRASLVCPVVGNETGFGVRVAKFGSGQFAHGYNGSFSHASKLGALVEAAATNLCLYSENVNTGWSASGTGTAVDDVGEAPDGTYTAGTFTAGAANVSRWQQMGILPLSQHTFSTFVRRNGATDVSCKLRIYNEGTATFTDEIAFTATSEWQRVSLPWTPSTSANQRVYVTVITNGESIYFWGSQVEAGYLSSYIPTTSASATRAVVTADLTNAGGNTYLQSAAGETEVVAALNVDATSAGRGLVDADNGTDSKDRAYLEVQSAGTVRARIYDSVATLTQNMAAADPGVWDQEHTLRLRWDSASGVDGNAENADVIVDTTRTAGAATTWTAGANATKLLVGNTLAGKRADGVIARLRVWDAPRAE